MRQAAANHEAALWEMNVEAPARRELETEARAEAIRANMHPRIGEFVTDYLARKNAPYEDEYLLDNIIRDVVEAEKSDYDDEVKQAVVGRRVMAQISRALDDFAQWRAAQ